MNTPQGRKQGVDTMRKKHGEDVYAKIGAKGGAKSPNRPMKDPEYARKLTNIRWAKYRAKKAAEKEAQEDGGIAQV